VLSRSSIFSFDTLQVRWKVPRGLLTAILLLGVLDCGLSRADWPYRKYPLSFVGTFFSQEEALRNDPVPPGIIILGNSRSEYGLLAREMERFLGLPNGAVLNLSLDGGDHYDNDLFQKRNRQTMKSARLLIYSVDAYQWNDNFPLNERFHHFAGLTDRLNFEPSVPSLFGWFFRTEQKAALYHAIFRQIEKRVVDASHLAGRAVMDDASANQPTSPAPLGPIEDWVSSWYKNFRLSPRREKLLQQIVGRAQEDGQRVLIVQLPFRDEYIHELYRSHASDYAAYERSIGKLHGVDVKFFETASGCGLVPTDFKDWSHLNAVGAEKFTRRWCDWLATHDKDIVSALGTGRR
jgi:hypothetical protein